MKLAFVYDQCYPFTIGGGEKRLYLLSRELAKRKYEVHVFTQKYWNGPDAMEFEGTFLHGVCKPRKQFNKIGKRSVFSALVFSLLLMPKLFSEKFDHVDCQVFPFFSIFLCKLYCIAEKIPLTVTCFEFWDSYWFNYLGFMGFFGKIVEKRSLNLANRIIVLSETVSKRLLKSGFSGKKIFLIKPGIEFPKESFYKTETDVVFAGRLIREKNAGLLIEAISIIAKKNKPISCVIVGNGPEKKKLQECCRKLSLGKNIKFLDFVSEQELSKIFFKSKVFVLPSEREGFGLVCLEAMAHGLPAITTYSELNAAKDLVEDGFNGFNCDFNRISVAEKISKLLDDKILLEKMSKNAKAFSAGFGLEKFVSDYEIFMKSK